MGCWACMHEVAAHMCCCCPASVCMLSCTQLINMYWALRQLGRRLVVPPDTAAVPAVVTYEEVLQYLDQELDFDGRLSVRIMFPATEGTIKRLMDKWWEVKVRQQPR